MTHRYILGTRIDAVPPDSLADTIVEWASRGLQRSVCLADYATVLAGQDRPDLRRAANAANLVAASDRMLAWALRFALVSNARFVDPDALLQSVLDKAATRGIPVSFEPPPSAGHQLWISSNRTGALAVCVGQASLEWNARTSIPTTCRFAWRVLREAMDPAESTSPGSEAPKPPQAKAAAGK